MSRSNDNSQRPHSSQAQNHDKAISVNSDTPQELLRLQCEYYRSMNALITQETANNLGRRIALLSQGSYLPQGGFGDVATLGAFLNLDPRSVFDQLKKTDHEKLGFGQTVFYSIAEWFLAKRRPDKPVSKK